MTAVEWLELKLLGLISFDSEELRAKYKDRVAKAKEIEKQHLIDIMESDEELGLYDESREINLEEVFNDDKRENIKKFIDEINNPSQPNAALKDAFNRHFGKPEHQLYSEIERLIIEWNLDGTRTAGDLTRKIMKLIKS